jgi:bifunctional non-homologous end joining protein LigD
MTTGGKGLHVVVPLDATVTWPKVTTSPSASPAPSPRPSRSASPPTSAKWREEGRIFLDWLRNQRGATAIMPYSARARDGAPVAAPIGWEELDGIKGGNVFTILDADELLERASSKLLAGWGQAKQKLPKA